MPVLVPSSPVSSLVSDLIEQTRRLVYGNSRLELNRLAGNIDEDDTSIVCSFDLQGAVRGATLGINNEIVYVLDAVPNTRTLTVRRGYYGTTAAGHASGDLIEVNSRFPRAYISDALKREIDTYAPRLYKVKAANILISSTSRSLDLSGLTPFLRVIDVRTSPYTGRTTRPQIARWAISRDMDATDFASGVALQLLASYPVTGTLRVRVAQAFDVSNWNDNLDVVSEVGMGTSMLDIPPLGAAWRLMAVREVQRTSPVSQPEPRRAEEVPAGHMQSTAQQLKQLRDVRISEEQIRLQEMYPVRGVA